MVVHQKIRASDRDRQQVVDRLRSALGDGRLRMDEYVDRMEAAYQAATYGDLAPLCADLPASNPVIARPRTAAAASAPPAVSSCAGYLAGLPAVLKDLWSIWLFAVSASITLFRRSRPPRACGR
jgi:Asp-tRNA(Asn)/Glu-tRNA(Gln) amidotransferase A subunit family amidase